VSKLSDYQNVSLTEDNQITLEIGGKQLIPEFIKKLAAQNAAIYEVKILDGLEEWFMTITDKK
jgi:ABC-2 type transport system ATP-binding protein